MTKVLLSTNLSTNYLTSAVMTNMVDKGGMQKIFFSEGSRARHPLFLLNILFQLLIFLLIDLPIFRKSFHWLLKKKHSGNSDEANVER